MKNVGKWCGTVVVWVTAILIATGGVIEVIDRTSHLGAKVAFIGGIIGVCSAVAAFLTFIVWEEM